jgi:hypothetical protein
LLWTVVLVLGRHSDGKLVGGCQSIIVWRDILSLVVVWSDGTLLDHEAGAAVQTAGEFHNDIVVVRRCNHL